MRSLLCLIMLITVFAHASGKSKHSFNQNFDIMVYQCSPSTNLDLVETVSISAGDEHKAIEGLENIYLSVKDIEEFDLTYRVDILVTKEFLPFHRIAVVIPKPDQNLEFVQFSFSSAGVCSKDNVGQLFFDVSYGAF